jgi:hypothetical protein
VVSHGFEILISNCAICVIRWLFSDCDMLTTKLMIVQKES